MAIHDGTCGRRKGGCSILLAPFETTVISPHTTPRPGEVFSFIYPYAKLATRSNRKEPNGKERKESVQIWSMCCPSRSHTSKQKKKIDEHAGSYAKKRPGAYHDGALGQRKHKGKNYQLWTCPH